MICFICAVGQMNRPYFLAMQRHLLKAAWLSNQRGVFLSFVSLS